MLRTPGGDVARGTAVALPGMVRIPGGTFRMGSDRHYPEEAPAHHVTVAGFWMDASPVTNADFARFVAATGYVTVAERPPDPAEYPGADPALLVPGASVFHATARPVDMRDVHHWWRYVPGACWRHDEGPGSDLAGRENHPVVHVAYEDAATYAAWAGKSLPTEAEWEFAARGGLEEAEFAWGDDLKSDGRWLANVWQGAFPWLNLASDGFEGASPVGSFPPNGYGLFDMTGNVWEWTSDWYAAKHAADAAKACCVPVDPRGAPMEASYDPTQPHVHIPRKVVKGGSFLCSADYCYRFRPAARQPQMIDTAMSHLGFRCVMRGTR